MPASAPVTALGPPTLSNLGPGFDALGLCIEGPSDRVTATRTDAPGVTVEAPDPLPAAPEANTAGRAALHVLRQAGADGGLHLRVEKGIPLGSGVGGSSASAVAGAVAANAALGSPFQKSQLVEAVLAGEAAGGSAHGDNVLPALFGGMVLVSPADPTTYRRLTLPGPPSFAVVLPELEVLTADARAALPASVPHREAVDQAASLAFLVRAALEGDWTGFAKSAMRDRLAEPFRAPLVPVYEAVKAAALEAGAVGCALSGSGPAMFAVPARGADVQPIVDAMVAASRAGGVDALGWAAAVDPRGARVVPGAP